MKIDSPADFLQKIQRNTKAFTAAKTAGDLITAQRSAKECAALFRRLAQMVPLREHEYLKFAKEWDAKAQEPEGAERTRAGNGDPAGADFIKDEVPVPDEKERSAPGISATSSPPKIPHEVFISYSNPEKNIAYDLCSYLESHDIPCWIAPRDVTPGTSFPASIIDAIDSSKAMVLIFSKSSNNSPHVVRELTRAVTKNVVILPFRIEDTPLSKNMEYLINLPHWMDALPPPPQQHFSALAETLRAHLSRLQSANSV